MNEVDAREDYILNFRIAPRFDVKSAGLMLLKFKAEMVYANCQEVVDDLA